MTPRRIFLWFFILWMLLVAGFWKISFPDYHELWLSPPSSGREVAVAVHEGRAFADLYRQPKWPGRWFGAQVISYKEGEADYERFGYLLRWSDADGTHYSLNMPLWVVWLVGIVVTFAVMRIAQRRMRRTVHVA